MSKKLIIVGDTHGNFKMLEEIFEKERETGDVVAILHAGDVGVYDEESIGLHDEVTGKFTGRLPKREIKLILKHKNPVGEFLPYMQGEKKFPVPVYTISGNHEDFALYDEFLNEKKRIENFIPMHPAKVYNLKFGNKELIISGLGKILTREGETSNKEPAYITDDEYNQMQKTLRGNKIDIFLLHEALYLTAFREGRGLFSFGCQRITDLIQHGNIDKVFVGHMHFEYTYVLGRTNIWGLGYGVVGRYAIVDTEMNVQYRSIKEEPISFAKAEKGRVLS